MYKVFHNISPSVICSIFSKCSTVQSYCTRSSSLNFFVNACCMDVRKYFISHQGVMLWNSLPAELKQSSSFKKFKQLIKDKIFAQYD